LSDQFVLRHARFRISGHWSANDYDVMHGDAVVGRTFRPAAGAPADTPWQWTILDPAVPPQVGFAETREQAPYARD